MTDDAALVTGGAGYIGSHVAWALIDRGWRVVVVDDLSAGERDLVPAPARFIQGDVGDGPLMRSLLREERITAVLHLAGSIIVPESISDPILYYRNNLCRSIELIDACLASGVGAFIFSSTAAVYGEPAEIPIPETAPTLPLSPYGHSKLMVEQVLRNADHAHGLPHISLRYFNVAGADAAGRSGQCGVNGTHLIKVACEVATGSRAAMEIYGTDYDTPDGTAIRDYIHVVDLADAHLRALDYLLRGGASAVLNCGYGRGYSVREVLNMVEQVAGHPIPARPALRRAGDAPRLVARPGALRERLGWRPCHDDLEKIVATALAWERRRVAAALQAEGSGGRPR